MPDDDRLLRQRLNDLRIVSDDLLDADAVETRGITLHAFDFAFDARPRWREYFVAARFIEALEFFPRTWSDPEAVNKDDGFGRDGRFHDKQRLKMTIVSGFSGGSALAAR